MREIGNKMRRLIAISRFFVDERSDRNGQFKILSGMTGSIRSLAMLPTVGGELGVEAVVDERIRVGTGDDEDGAAVAAIATAWATAGHTNFPAERKAPAPTCTSRDVNIYFVNEHRIWSSHHQSIWPFLQIE
jgi:hypothetical protein